MQTNLIHGSRRDGLSSSALQIYLAYTLNDTEDIIRAGRHDRSFSTRFFQANSAIQGGRFQTQWTLAVKAAERVISCIKMCMNALDSSKGVSLYVTSILCTLDACQDSLSEAYQATQCYTQDQYELHVRKSEKYECKATFLTCVFEALQRDDDHDLQQMWILAARNINEEIDLQLDMFYKQSSIAKASLQRAKEEETYIDHCRDEWSEIRLHYRMRALYHLRHAAAMSALNRLHSHIYAAEIYLQASSVCAQIDNAKNSSVISVLEQAVCKLQLALERIELLAGSNSAVARDATVLDLVKTAEHLRDDAYRATEFSTAVEARKAELACTLATERKCQDAAKLPVWRILRAEQEEAIIKAESVLSAVEKGELDVVSGLATVKSSADKVKALIDTVNEVQSCHQRINCYKQRASQALKANISPKLANMCWTQAAQYMEAAAQVCINVIMNKTYLVSSLDQTQEWQSRCGMARKYIAIADDVLANAAKYLDKARGAEVGVENGRDPREAQMWRKAADCLVQKAGLQFNEANSVNMLPDSSDSEAVDVIDAESLAYIKTAEHFYLAYKHRELPDAETRLNGTRVAILYERAADLMCGRFEAAGSAEDSLVDTVLTFHSQAIHRLNESITVPAAEVMLWERGSDYGIKALSDSFKPNSPTRHWYQAFCLTNEFMTASTRKRDEELTMLTKGLIALHVCAAEAALPRAKICYEACIMELSSIVTSYHRYNLELIANMFRTEELVIPSEVQSVLELASTSQYRPALLDGHTQALLLKAKCLYRLETHTDDEQELGRNSWEEAYNATIDLCQAYTLCVIEFPAGENSARLRTHLAYRQTVARCLVRAADSAGCDVTATGDIAAWPEAATAMKTTSPLNLRIALIAVEQYTWAADQAQLQVAAGMLGQDGERLLKGLIIELKLAAVAARQLSMFPEDEKVRLQFRVYEVDVLRSVERLRREHVLDLTAYTIYWGK